jgi:hypothetical protein
VVDDQLELAGLYDWQVRRLRALGGCGRHRHRSGGAPANTDTVPAKFSPKNAADDALITIARTFKMITQDERRTIYEELKHQATPNIGTKLPPNIELQSVTPLRRR